MTEPRDPPPDPPPATPGGYPVPPPPYPGGYPAPYPGYGPPWTGPRNGMGTAALVVAILGLVASPSVLGGVVLGIVAVVLGFVGRGRAKRGEANNGGIAIAGVVLGFLAIVTGIAFTLIYFGLFKSAGGEDYVHCLDKAGSDRAAQQKCADQLRDQVGDKFGITLTPAPPAP